MSHTRPEILSLLLHNDRAVCRAVVALYRRQTASEQSQYSTQEQNGRGFNASDAPMCTRVAKKLLAEHDLDDEELGETRHRMLKYTNQLLEIAVENELKQFINN